jgi:P-type Ca2+ transporter type 2C
VRCSTSQPPTWCPEMSFFSKPGASSRRTYAFIESAQLRVAEAALTGESEAVEKRVEAVPGNETPLGDRRSMAYRGTQVVHGRGEGVAAETGLATELGRIAGLIAGTEDVKTPLQKRLAGFGRTLGLAALGLCAIVFVVGIIRGEDVLLMFLTAVSLAVAAVPEALPAVATITLALGARRMVRTNALVRRLPAVETLGSVTYICTDKTGTLTVNRMTAERFLADGQAAARPDGVSGPVWEMLWRGMALCSDVVPGPDGEPLGDPTETALYAAAAEAGFTRGEVEDDWPRVAELPFDSERKLMTTFHTARRRASSPSPREPPSSPRPIDPQLCNEETGDVDTEELEADIDEISGRRAARPRLCYKAPGDQLPVGPLLGRDRPRPSSDWWASWTRHERKPPRRSGCARARGSCR